MNFSMQDTFNLGWKLASVLRGQCAPELLHSYSAERQSVAQELIDFDRTWAKMFSDRPSEGGEGGVDPKAFEQYFVKQGRFTAGTETHYRPSLICGESTHQALAQGFTIGKRFHSAPVVRLADARPLHLGHVARADGRWRLYAFAGTNDDGGSESGIRALCEYLSDSPASPLRRFTPTGEDIDSVFDVRVIYQQAHTELSLDSMPALLFPSKGQYGLIDYEKVFCPYLKTGSDIFDVRGIDRQQGCLVVVRPDQYVAQVLPFYAHAELAEFFAGFMVNHS